MRALIALLGIIVSLAPLRATAQDADAGVPQEDPAGPAEPPPPQSPFTVQEPPASDVPPPTTAPPPSASSTAPVEPAAPPAASRRSSAAAPASAGTPQVIVRRHRAERAPPPEEEPAPDPGDPYDILWIDLFGGVSYVDLRAIDATNYYPEFVRLSGIGPVFGLGLGFRIEFVSVGVRAALARYDASDAAAPDALFDLGTLAAEVSLALPIGIFKPYIRVGVGFAWHGDSNFDAPTMSQTTVYGWTFQGAVGLDIYVANWFAIGAAVAVDVLNMNRQSFSEPVADPGMVEFAQTGDAVGLAARGQLDLSFHF